jgi:hypothetical protein
MRSRALRIVLAVVGVALLSLGLSHTAADILGSFHASGSSALAEAITLMFRVHWLAAALAGAFLCVLSFILIKRKVRHELSIAEQGRTESGDDASVADQKPLARGR